MLNNQKNNKMTQALKQYREKLAEKWFKTSYDNLKPFGKKEVDWAMECEFEHLR